MNTVEATVLSNHSHTCTVFLWQQDLVKTDNGLRQNSNNRVIITPDLTNVTVKRLVNTAEGNIN